jgi:hypothetical protein
LKGLRIYVGTVIPRKTTSSKENKNVKVSNKSACKKPPAGTTPFKLPDASKKSKEFRNSRKKRFLEDKSMKWRRRSEYLNVKLKSTVPTKCYTTTKTKLRLCTPRCFSVTSPRNNKSRWNQNTENLPSKSKLMLNGTKSSNRRWRSTTQESGTKCKRKWLKKKLILN